MESLDLCSMSLMASGQLRLGHYYTAQLSSRWRETPSQLAHDHSNFMSLLTVSSAHTKTKKTKSVYLCSAQLISAQLGRAYGQKTNKKTGPRSWDQKTKFTHIPVHLPSHMSNIYQVILCFIQKSYSIFYQNTLFLFPLWTFYLTFSSILNRWNINVKYNYYITHFISVIFSSAGEFVAGGLFHIWFLFDKCSDFLKDGNLYTLFACLS